MQSVRADFPFLDRRINGRPVVYLDSAATTQKPRQVIDCLTNLYSSGISNVHRAVNVLADEVTQAFEAGRASIADFIGAYPTEIVFVSNATQALNVVCNSLVRDRRPRVLTTTLEHHSNLLPWVQKASVEWIPWTADGSLDMQALRSGVRARPDLVAVSAASNFLGSLSPVEEIAQLCREYGVPLLIDASQSIGHRLHDVGRLGCDYLVFSGHKAYGPSGIGVLYAKTGTTGTLSPMLLGGSMVKEVHADSFVLNSVPYRFEAGTPNIEGVIGLAAALDYLGSLGLEQVAEHECRLVQRAKQRLSAIPRVQLLGPPPGVPCAPIVAFQIEGLSANAVAKALGNRANIIVRAGFHCAQPAHDTLGVGPTVRASFGLYNTFEDVDQLAATLESICALIH